MAHPIPTSLPATLRAGDTATWTRTLADYPASAGWVLSYALVNSAGRITFSASASGDDHLVSVAPDTTAAWSAGQYQWSAKVSLSGAVYTVETGAVEILSDYSAASTGLDDRSHARKTLAALEAWIEARDIGVAEYQIAGRTLKTIPIEQLIKLRSQYKREVRLEDDAQRAAAGLPSRNTLLVRFSGTR